MAAERVICVVDDMEPMLAIASDFLQRRLDNVRVVTFQKPTLALAWLREHEVDLILSDNHMGEMDGLTFLDQSRALRPDALRVLMTAYLDIVATPSQLGARGLHALIRKPWEWNDFGRALFEILAMTPEDRAHAASAGPLAYPEGAFAEFAGSRRGAVGSRAVGGGTTAVPTRKVVETEAEPTLKTRPLADITDRPTAPPPTARSPPPSDAPPPTAPAPTAPSRVIAAPGHNRLACPHCMIPIDVEVQLPRAMPNATEEDEARKLLTYLAAHPGVAAHLARLWTAAQARPPPAVQRPPPRQG